MLNQNNEHAKPYDYESNFLASEWFKFERILNDENHLLAPRAGNDVLVMKSWYEMPSPVGPE